jgi:CHASE2 domain-containing sensor protein
LGCQASALVAVVSLRSNARVVSAALFWILGAVVGLVGLIIASRTDARDTGPVALAVSFAIAGTVFVALALVLISGGGFGA